jgi:hypothetical protein
LLVIRLQRRGKEKRDFLLRVLRILRELRGSYSLLPLKKKARAPAEAEARADEETFEATND